MLYHSLFQLQWQSDGNNFRGDVVLDRVNMAYMDESSILDQKYESWIFIMKIFDS